MKIFNFAVILTSILFSMKSYSQDTRLGLEDLIPGGKNFNAYRTVMPRQLSWSGDKLAYIKGDSILSAPLQAKESTNTLTCLDEINKGIDPHNSTIKSMNSVRLIPNKPNTIMLTTEEYIYLYNFADKKVIGKFSRSNEMENPDLAHNNYLAYTKVNNLYIQSPEGKEQIISADENKGIVYGQSVHRNEFGINKGTFWSPAGDLLAFYRMDETMVTDYPLVDISARTAKLKNIKYPMAGMKSHQVTVGVYNPQTEKTIYLKTGTPKEKYLTNIAWSPDSKSIYIAELNRGQDTCMLKRYDVATGNLEKTLFTETHAKYVEPEHPVMFLKNDSQKFIWQSERDGFNHLYLYDINGNLIKQITSGHWDITSVLGFDEKGEHIIYTSTETSPIEQHAYKVNLKTGKRTKLSQEEGVHNISLNSSGKYICDTYNSQYNPGKIAVTNTASGQTNLWYTAKNPYRDITLPEITLGRLKANDGKTDLYYRMVKPSDFDPNKKYPVIIYVYGGPHSQLVDNSWMAQARGWDIYMAQKGYIIFTLDNRGTANRGINFENITHRQLGVVETQDQMTGVEYLKSLSYVDTKRIGVHGWSYGGFMTLNLMLRHPETFKVGVAGGPVTNWKYYEIMYGERYMDSPQENPEGYSETNMVQRAKNLKGRLLLIHGDEDPVVVMQHNLQFIKSAIKNGTHPDLFLYPGHGHNMTGHDRVHLHEHITRYFEDFLK